MSNPLLGLTEADMLSKIISEEYKMWKKNTPFLYDLVMSDSLEWPSLTVQWLPDKVTVPGKDYTVQRLLLGTHTSDGEQNYLQIAEVRLPADTSVIDKEGAEDEEDGIVNRAPKTAADAAAASGPVGGYGAAAGKIDITQQIVHDGEVNRARYMPQNPNIIASKSPNAEVFVFDRTKHMSRPDKNAPFAPDMRLGGHKAEGYGLAWNPMTEGLLASGSQDNFVCLWQIAANGSSSSPQDPLLTFVGHAAAVEDVAWHPEDSNVLVSCGDDNLICVWDQRMGKAAHVVEGHKAEVNSIAFNPHDVNILASASSDKTAGLWDVRALDKKLHSFEYHEDQVFNVAWAPFASNVLATSSADRRLCLWDLNAIGREQDAEDAEDGPPELLFLHAGHTAKISDIAWNGNDAWVMASVDEDNTLQIWQPSAAVREGEGEDEDEDEDDEGDDLE